MNSGVFLDTSFLISLANPKDSAHGVAYQYFRHFLNEGIPMGLSAIVVAEYCVNGKWETLTTEQFILESFTQEDARHAASLDFKRLQLAEKNPAPGFRQALKDDLKIIGHAHSRDYSYLITGDAKMFGYCEDFKKEGATKFMPLNLGWGFRKHPFTEPVTPFLDF